MSNLGHRALALQCRDESPLFVCVRCKTCACLGRVLRLSRACGPTKTGRNYKDRWRLMKRGFHPKLKR
eukprot:1128946-Pyramimonas_sp.AAC.1